MSDIFEDYERIIAENARLERELAEVRATRFSNDEMRQAYKSGVAAERERCIGVVMSVMRGLNDNVIMVIAAKDIIARINAPGGEGKEVKGE